MEECSRGDVVEEEMENGANDEEMDGGTNDKEIIENGVDSAAEGKQPLQNIDANSPNASSESNKTGDELKKKKKKKKKTPKGGTNAHPTCCQGHGHGHGPGDHSHGGYPDGSGAVAGEADNQMSPTSAKDMHKVFKRIFIESRNAAGTDDKQRKDKKYQFWDTQPVPKLDESIDANVNEPVEENKADIRQQPFSLPSGFTWDTLNIENTDELKELYTLLNENYVEDDDNMFRFDYSPNFLRWALCPPGWKKVWHCCVRVSTNKKLVGFISAIPARIRIYTKEVDMVEINFLCVHKKLRAKRVAPVLIREITRRVNLEGIFQAGYTAGVILPRPVGTCRYWHRSLNPKKLIDVKFSHLKRNMTMQRTIKLYKLPEQTKLPTLRSMTESDIASGHKMLTEHLKNFDLAPVFTVEEFRHWFMPVNDVIVTYVTCDETTGEVDNLLSFYQLPSTVVDHPRYKSLKAAYSFYNVAKKNDLSDLMHDALVIAKNDNYDVFNALNLMNNGTFLEDLKFGIGDGNLNYYLYNWKCPSIEPEKIGLVLQ